jgi:hypothetical protein
VTSWFEALQSRHNGAGSVNFVVLIVAKFWANSIHITFHFHFKSNKENHGTTELNSRETETQITGTTSDAVNLHIITSSEKQIPPRSSN